eukprot:scaffold60046_cov24-Cyclotella_meneghiniana.AAC.2
MFYQDNIDGEAALLPEIWVDVPELANVDPEVSAQLSQGKREPGGTDPVYDEDEVENELASLAGKTRTAGARDGSNVDEAREGEPKDEDSVATEASVDSDTNENENSRLTGAVTRSGRAVLKPFWMDNDTIPYEMSAAEMRLLKAELMNDDDGEVALVGATGEGFSHTSELNVMNYRQAMNAHDATEWQVEVDKEHKRMVDKMCGS